MTEFQYSLHPKAQAEFETSIIWYKERSEKTAKGFVEAVQKAIDLICTAPYRWRLEYRNFRSLGLRKYPFTIVYTVDESIHEVQVVAIYH